jgi:hypothetical protein
MARARRQPDSSKAEGGSQPLHMTFRLSIELREKLAAAAITDGDRTIGEEIRQRLESSFETSIGVSADPWFGDLLTALAHAATGAEKLRPVPKAMLTAADIERQEWLQRRQPGSQDTTAYECFVEAAAMLFQAFAPDGVISVTPETGVRLSYQVAARALGQLGDGGDAAFTKLPPMDQDLMDRFGGSAARRLAAEARDEHEGSKP